jgi:hypothetical protein
MGTLCGDGGGAESGAGAACREAGLLHSGLPGRLPYYLGTAGSVHLAHRPVMAAHRGETHFDGRRIFRYIDLYNGRLRARR